MRSPSWGQRLKRWWRTRDLGSRFRAQQRAGADSSFGYERVHVHPGDGFGQFCKLTPTAEKRLLTDYRSVSGLLGRANSEGVPASDFPGIEAMLSPLRLDVLSDDDVEFFEDVHNFRMPLGVENNFRIHVCPLSSAQEQREQELCERRQNIPQMRGLPFGLPATCDAFCAAPFTGHFHGFGIVPAIPRQQFVIGSDCPAAGFTWVRFDKRDLITYDHDLEGLPVVHDGDGILFPVTHLWVDFNFPTAAYALEWFCGTRCVVQKQLSLWPMPNFIFNKIIDMTLGNLNGLAPSRDSSAD